MALSRDNDYAMYLYTCNRCRACAVEPSAEQAPLCPSYAHFGYFAYTGGGRGYVAQGILEGKVKPSEETAEVAMNCLMCGACAQACPPGFDINAFIRDLRDHLVLNNCFANPAHQRVIERLKKTGNPWGRAYPPADLPRFTGEQELLVWRGCKERLNNRLTAPVSKILESAGVSWGVLEDEPCCGAPHLDLGDKAGFEEQAAKTLEAIANSGAERMLILCPHCVAAMGADYIEVGDLEAEPLSLPMLLAELIDEDKLKLSGGPEVQVTFHDPCRLARWLEDVDSARAVLESIEGVELIEMDRSGEWTWCCGSGGWSSLITPELSRFAAKERVREAKATGAEVIVTACSYCEDMLSRTAGKRMAVTQLADLVAGRIS
jgi:Fe-S oxidoreductase